MVEKKIIRLFGDSTLDNAGYTGEGSSTSAVLSGLMAENEVELHAVDGNKMLHVKGKIKKIGEPSDIAVLSVGGNDLLDHVQKIIDPEMTGIELLDYFSGVGAKFEREYQALVDELRTKTHWLVLCTVYEPKELGFCKEDLKFEIKDGEETSLECNARRVSLLIKSVNDQIMGIATKNGLDVIRLSSVFSGKGDFTQMFEPSISGAKKFAEAIQYVVDVGPADNAGITFGRAFSRDDEGDNSGKMKGGRGFNFES